MGIGLDEKRKELRVRSRVLSVVKGSSQRVRAESRQLDRYGCSFLHSTDLR